MDTDTAIQEIRSFNRFYTNILSLLDQSLLRSGYSLAEARVLYELRNMGPCGAREIMSELNIDEGYLSRILNQFVRKGLIQKTQSSVDKRQYILSLSRSGQQICQDLDHLANASVGEMISHLSKSQLTHFLGHMTQITELLQHDKPAAH